MSVHELPAGLPPLERPDVDWERHGSTGAPKILPPPGAEWRSESGKTRQRHRYYTRVTTYADAITDTYNLMRWQMRRVALGLGQRPDYVRLAAALTDRDDDRDALDELVGKAKEAAGPNRADEGTALHALTERIDRGEDLGNPPPELANDLAAYAALSERALRFVERECRVVCDELETAGTPDGIAYVAEPCPAGCGPDVLHVVDTKTGSVRYPGKMSTQLAIYAHSDKYDPATGERTPLGNVCHKWGAIVHLPVEQGRASPFWLDLEHGWAGALLCGPVRRWNAARADDVMRPFTEIPPLEVVDGEVREVDRRLASDKSGAPAPAELTELPPLTELEVAEAAAGDAADRAEQAWQREVARVERARLVEIRERPDGSSEFRVPTGPAERARREVAEAVSRPDQGLAEALGQHTPTPVVDWTVDRPRAAFEAAVRATTTLAELTDLAVRHRDAEWITPELRELANARWWELRGQNAREGRVTVAVVDLRGGAS
jgi:hypothetical protein